MNSQMEQELREHCNHYDREPGDRIDIDVDDLEYLLDQLITEREGRNEWMRMANENGRKIDVCLVRA
jgi:hypothetical protein